MPAFKTTQKLKKVGYIKTNKLTIKTNQKATDLVEDANGTNHDSLILVTAYKNRLGY